MCVCACVSVCGLCVYTCPQPGIFDYYLAVNAAKCLKYLIYVHVDA